MLNYLAFLCGLEVVFQHQEYGFCKAYGFESVFYWCHKREDFQGRHELSESMNFCFTYLQEFRVNAYPIQIKVWVRFNCFAEQAHPNLFHIRLFSKCLKFDTELRSIFVVHFLVEHSPRERLMLVKSTFFFTSNLVGSSYSFLFCVICSRNCCLARLYPQSYIWIGLIGAPVYRTHHKERSYKVFS